MIVCVTLEGVLVRNDRRPLFECQTLTAGISMATALGEVATVVVVTSREKREVEPWMRARGPRHDALVGPWSGPLWRGDEESARGHDRVLRLQEMATGGSRVAFAIEADPGVAAAMLASGFAVLLAAWPSSVIRDWSWSGIDSGPPTEWGVIMEEMARQEMETGNEEPPVD